MLEPYEILTRYLSWSDFSPNRIPSNNEKSTMETHGTRLIVDYCASRSRYGCEADVRIPSEDIQREKDRKNSHGIQGSKISHKLAFKIYGSARDGHISAENNEPTQHKKLCYLIFGTVSLTFRAITFNFK